MKNTVILTASAAVLLTASLSHAWAVPAQQNPQATEQPAQLIQPMPAQPAPVVSTPAPQERVSLGDSGTMWADEAAAKAAAAQTPAAGDASPVTPVPATSAPVTAPAPKTVGGALMLPSKNIVENATASKDHTTLVKAVKAADLVQTLSGPGPFTVFAPTNRAFAKLPKQSLADLLKPAGKEKLVKLLQYHVIVGTHDAASILADIKTGGGTATYQTVAGSELKARVVKGVVTLTDENGNISRVTIPDVYQSNGVIHVVDTVVIPK